MGNCPLFDSVEDRHENDIKEAEKAARKKVLEENPDLAPDFLDFRISKKVKKDDNRRKHREQRIRDRALFGIRPEEGMGIINFMQEIRQENQAHALPPAPQQQQQQPRPQQDRQGWRWRRHFKHAAAHRHVNDGGAIPAPPAVPFPGNYQDVQWVPQPQQMPQLPPEEQHFFAIEWGAFQAPAPYQHRPPFQPFNNQNNRQQ
jgi:hypothetical protein